MTHHQHRLCAATISTSSSSTLAQDLTTLTKSHTFKKKEKKKKKKKKRKRKFFLGFHTDSLLVEECAVRHEKQRRKSTTRLSATLAKAYACSNFTTKQITNLKSLKSRAFFQVSFFSSPAYTAGSKPKAAAAPKKTVRKVAAAAGGAKKKSRSRAKGNFFFCFFFYTAKKKKKKNVGAYKVVRP
jgi:hypothetical protein